MNAERWKLVTIQERRGGVAKAVCMARTTACGLSNNYLPRLCCTAGASPLSLWGLRLHYASLSIGRRGKQSQWLPLGRGASKAAAAAVACSKLFYERCKAFLIKTPLAQLMKVNNFHFPLSYFFPSKRRCRHMQCRQITFCVENNSLPFLYSLPLWLGLKIIQVINRVRQRSQLQQWQLCITGRWAWVGRVLLSGTAKPISCVKTKHAEELSMRN